MVKFLLLVFLLSSCSNFVKRSPSGLEGDRIGNGGGAWVCSKNGEITSITSFDLFEAQNLWNKNIIPNNKTYEEFVQIAKSKIKKSKFTRRDILFLSFLDIDEEFNTALQKLKPLNSKIKDLNLKPTEDVSPFFFQPDCEYKQIITYFDEDTWLYDPKLFNQLDNLSRAALITHEIIYSFLRKTDKVETSIRTRRMVGSIFSDFEPVDLIGEPFNENRFYRFCQSTNLINHDNKNVSTNDLDIRFYARKEKNKDYFRFFFAKIGNRSIPWEEYIDVPEMVYEFKKFPECYTRPDYKTFTKPPKGYNDDYPTELPVGNIRCSKRTITGKTISDFENGEKIEIAIIKKTEKKDDIEIFLPRLEKRVNITCY